MKDKIGKIKKELNLPFKMEERELMNYVILFNTLEKKDDDVVILIVGEPGAGKSTRASQISYVFNRLFGYEKNDTENIFFDGKKYEKKARNSKKQVLILDESYGTMSSKRSMSTDNFVFGQMLRDVRYNNHVHIFLMQDLWDFEKNVVFQRADIMVYCYKKPNKQELILDKGFSKIFGRKKIKRVYIEGMRYHDMERYPFDDGYFTFPNKFMFDKEGYMKLKDAYVKKEEEEKADTTKPSKQIERYQTALRVVHYKDRGFPIDKAAEQVAKERSSVGFDITSRSVLNHYYFAKDKGWVI